MRLPSSSSSRRRDFCSAASGGDWRRSGERVGRKFMKFFTYYALKSLSTYPTHEIIIIYFTATTYRFRVPTGTHSNESWWWTRSVVTIFSQSFFFFFFITNKWFYGNLWAFNNINMFIFSKSRSTHFIIYSSYFIIPKH